MSGFLSSKAAMMICTADSKVFDIEKLRGHSFSPELEADGIRRGWVGLGDPLDYESFDLANVSDRYVGFSFRQDARKPSGAVIKLQLAEAIKKEKGKVSSKRKKELKEAITASAIAKCDFSASLTDCIWDLEKNRLYVGASSEKALQPVLDQIKRTFGITPTLLTPSKNMGELFSDILRASDYQCGGFKIFSMGSASLASPEQSEEKASVAVQNNLNAVASALDEGLSIKKIHLQVESENTDSPLDFTLDTELVISGLVLPKGEKGDGDATFLLKADACAQAANIVEKLNE